MLHRYILEKPVNGRSKKKYKCPVCHQKRFTRYIDIESGEYLSDIVGRCDRENECTYHYTPSSFFSDTGYSVTQNAYNTKVAKAHDVTTDTDVTPVQYLPFEVMEKSVRRYAECNLFPFLANTFGEDPAARLCLDYFIGASKHGDTVFWQVDFEGNVRQAKVIQYDPETGRRNKSRGAYFVGKKILNDQSAHLEQCFFGERWLTDSKNTPVAIVESEKTAAIASMYYPEYFWIATGGKTGCKWTEAKICKVLKGRKVILFPDLNAYEAWNVKGKLMEAVVGCKVAVSSLLEDGATEEDKQRGLDLADYLLAERERDMQKNWH